MTYNGHIENGKVVFDEPADLAEGTRVRIDVPVQTEEYRDEPSSEEYRTIAEILAPLIGKAEGLPADWSENHDKYLREEHSE